MTAVGVAATLPRDVGPRLSRAFGIGLELVGRLGALAGLGLFAVIAFRNAQRERDVYSLLLFLDQAVNVLFVLTARWPRTIDRRPHVTLIAVGSTFSNLFLGLRSGLDVVPRVVVYALQLTGVAIQLVAKLSLGRSFGIVPANRGVKTGGAYRLVRHPTYAGYFVAQAGALLGSLSWRNAAVVATVCALLCVRVWLEERVLMKDETYRAYAARVRWRLVPGVL